MSSIFDREPEVQRGPPLLRNYSVAERGQAGSGPGAPYWQAWHLPVGHSSGAGPATAQPPLHLAACSRPHLSRPWGTVSAPGAKGHLGRPAGTDCTPHPSAGAQHLPWPSAGLWFWQTQKAVHVNLGAWIVSSALRSGAGARSSTERERPGSPCPAGLFPHLPGRGKLQSSTVERNLRTHW